MDHYNQKEIDVVREDVLPRLKEFQDIGIITPYNHQVDAFNQALPSISVGTIHKYQGRENDVIIMSVVDDQITEFADDPNLLNVAVSRAKSKFCLVVSGNEQEHKGNIQSLLDYIAYNNCSVTESKIASIFDHLYMQYTEQRMRLGITEHQISEYESENLTYTALRDILSSDSRFAHLHVICHFPLRMVIKDMSLMTEKEARYASNYCTHVDFLIVDIVSHKPVLAIEMFHNMVTRLYRCDRLKDNILDKYGLPLLRLRNKRSVEKEIVASKLSLIA